MISKIRKLSSCWILALFPMAMLHAQKAEWTYVKSEHFEMLSQKPEKQSRYMLVRLEQFRELFLSMFRVGDTHEAPIRLVVFGDRSEFVSYNKPGAAGICYPSDFETILSLNGDSGHLWSVMYHEYVHALIRPRVRQIPIWLNEGLAVAFSGFKIESNEMVTLGRPAAHQADTFMAAVKEGVPTIPMDLLLGKGKYYKDEKVNRLFYIQSWSIVYHLLFSEKYYESSPLPAMLNRMNDPKGKSQQEIIKETIGMDAEALMDEVKSYMFKGNYIVTKRNIPTQPILSTITSRKAEEWEVACALGQLKARKGDGLGAMKKLAKKNPGNTRIQEALVYSLTYHGVSPKELRGYVDEAIRCGSRNAYLYLLRARIEMEGLRWSPNASLPEEKSEALRGWLAKALEISPDYMEAYALAALVEGLSRKPNETFLNLAARKALDMSYSSVRMKVYIAMAMALDKKGKNRQALEWLAMVFEEQEGLNEKEDGLNLWMMDELPYTAAMKLARGMEKDIRKIQKEKQIE